MNRLLSIAAAADRLGVSVDTVRDLTNLGALKSVRTPGGHRRFLVEDLEGLDLDSPAPVLSFPESSNLNLPARPVSERAPEIPPWKERVEEERADLEVLKLRRSARDLHEEDRRRQEREAAAAAVVECRRREETRLEALRSFGLSQAQDVPVQWQAKVVKDLQRYVSLEQVPPKLPDEQARAFVSARVQRILKPYRIVMARAEEKRHREARRKSLIDSGNRAASLRTLWLDSPGPQEEARAAVAAELEDRIDADWTELEVKDLVNEVLQDVEEEWDEE